MEHCDHSPATYLIAPFPPSKNTKLCLCCSIFSSLSRKGSILAGANSTQGFFHRIDLQPSAINMKCTTTTSPTMPLHKDDAYFVARVLIGHIPIGRGISWVFRKVRRAVRQRPQGDEEAGSDQERDDKREAIIEILQHLREIRQSAAGPDSQS